MIANIKPWRDRLDVHCGHFDVVEVSDAEVAELRAALMDQSMRIAGMECMIRKLVLALGTPDHYKRDNFDLVAAASELVGDSPATDLHPDYCQACGKVHAGADCAPASSATSSV